ncbi:hypothetical protein AB6M97_03675 [Streptococcus hillyeri]|uniref:hypothetical protein n=1 Tax=Streptococcus hillyeri TaxID=2282420 RepID=UPI0034E23F2A
MNSKKTFPISLLALCCPLILMSHSSEVLAEETNLSDLSLPLVSETTDASSSAISKENEKGNQVTDDSAEEESSIKDSSAEKQDDSAQQVDTANVTTPTDTVSPSDVASTSENGAPITNKSETSVLNRERKIKHKQKDRVFDI